MHAGHEHDDGVAANGGTPIRLDAQQVRHPLVVTVRDPQELITIGITTIGTQAPLVNFEIMTTSSTTKVATAPTALMTTPRCQPGSRTLRWCTTMPACDSVNATNTPTAYSGISACRVAAEGDDQDAANTDEDQDAVGEDEPIAAVGELTGQVAVLRRGSTRAAGSRRTRCWRRGSRSRTS